MTKEFNDDYDPEWRTRYLHVPEDKVARSVRIGIAVFLGSVAVVMGVKAVTLWLASA